MTAILLRAFALNARKICKRPKLKSGAQRPEEIVLMTGQNISRPQAFERRVQSCARIRQRDAHDGEVHTVVRRQLRRCSSGVHINALAVHFDQKGQRLAANPIGSALRLTRL